MGTWGVGLYANDLAADLKTTIASVLRLPLPPDEVVTMLVEAEPCLADPADESYTDAWFVVADRLHRYGIDHEPTVQLVRQLIRNGTDLQRKAELGLGAGDLRARGKILDQLQQRLTTPHPKPFKTGSLTKPQAFVVEVGDVVAYPTMDGKSANPYFKDWSSARFTPNGYGAALVAGRGRTFGYLAWYTMAVLDATWSTSPSLDVCMSRRVGELYAGTLSRSHLTRMALDHVGNVEIIALPERTWSGDHPDSAAIHDISIANHLRVPRDVTGENPTLRDLARQPS
jgi:hypothetical protein